LAVLSRDAPYAIRHDVETPDLPDRRQDAPKVYPAIHAASPLNVPAQQFHRGFSFGKPQ
jgi:hypothetical protein